MKLVDSTIRISLLTSWQQVFEALFVDVKANPIQAMSPQANTDVIDLAKEGILKEMARSTFSLEETTMRMREHMAMTVHPLECGNSFFHTSATFALLTTPKFSNEHRLLPLDCQQILWLNFDLPEVFQLKRIEVYRV